MVHNKIFFFQAYFAFLCQRVEVWPTVLDPHELLYVFFFNLVNRTNVIGTNVTVTSWSTLWKDKKENGIVTLNFVFFSMFDVGLCTYSAGQKKASLNFCKYLHNGRSDLYEIWNLSLWQTRGPPNKFLYRSVHIRAHTKQKRAHTHLYFVCTCFYTKLYENRIDSAWLCHDLKF